MRHAVGILAVLCGLGLEGSARYAMVFGGCSESQADPVERNESPEEPPSSYWCARRNARRTDLPGAPVPSAPGVVRLQSEASAREGTLPPAAGLPRGARGYHNGCGASLLC